MLCKLSKRNLVENVTAKKIQDTLLPLSGTELFISKKVFFENKYDLERREIRKRWNSNGY